MKFFQARTCFLDRCYQKKTFLERWYFSPWIHPYTNTNVYLTASAERKMIYIQPNRTKKHAQITTTRDKDQLDQLPMTQMGEV